MFIVLNSEIMTISLLAEIHVKTGSTDTWDYQWNYNGITAGLQWDYSGITVGLSVGLQWDYQWDYDGITVGLVSCLSVCRKLSKQVTSVPCRRWRPSRNRIFLRSKLLL